LDKAIRFYVWSSALCGDGVGWRRSCEHMKNYYGEPRRKVIQYIKYNEGRLTGLVTNYHANNHRHYVYIMVEICYIKQYIFSCVDCLFA
jgi:hypothetical protein